MYMVMFRQQKAGQNHNSLMNNKFFENAAKFKYLGTKITIQDIIHEEIKYKINSENACYHCVQSLSCRLLSKNMKINI
jgi:heme-binding NEAT domain protein